MDYLQTKILSISDSIKSLFGTMSRFRTIVFCGFPYPLCNPVLSLTPPFRSAPVKGLFAAYPQGLLKNGISFFNSPFRYSTVPCDRLVSLCKPGFADNGEQLKTFSLHHCRTSHYTQGERSTASCLPEDLSGRRPGPWPLPENR